MQFDNKDMIKTAIDTHMLPSFLPGRSIYGIGRRIFPPP